MKDRTEYYRAQHLKNREQRNARALERYYANKEEIRKTVKERRETYPSVIARKVASELKSQRRAFVKTLRLVRIKRSVSESAQRAKENKRNGRKRRYWGDTQAKIAILLRTRLNIAMRKDKNHLSAVRNLGCSIAEFKSYIESKFEPGMTWDNWTTHGWHLDHILPLCSFDLTDPEEAKKACHYTNMRPLWAKENLQKNAQDQRYAQVVKGTYKKRPLRTYS